MSTGKIGVLVLYAVLVVLAISQAGNQIGSVANWVILALLVGHTLEVIVFFKLCRTAGGSLFGHLLNVFVFGVFHVKEIKASAAR